jgi:hypothetical protein
MRPMASYSVFDKLVSGLSSNERKDMLDRIASSLHFEPSAEDPVDEATVDLDESFRNMGLIRRLIVIVTAFFTGRERNSVVETYLLRDLGRRVNAVLPHGLDTVQQQLRAGAAEDFRTLADNARVFSTILARIMGNEYRTFVAFLAGLHAPEAQRQLVEDSDPVAIGAAQPELSLSEVKRRALNAVDGVVSTLPPRLRQSIYTDVRSIHQLMSLSSFPFDRVIAHFEPVAGGDPVPVSLSRIADDLGRLANIFEGLRIDPSPILLEALSIFQSQDRLGESDDTFEAVVTQDGNAFADAYKRIRGFRHSYPLADLVRIAHSNIHYRPTGGGGGEDWFAQWKGFWRDRIETLHRRFAYDRQMDATIRKASDLLLGKPIRTFPGYPPSGLDQPARHGFSAGFMHVLMSEVFDAEILAPVNELHREGEFYKADNRGDFDRVWSEIQRLKTEVANLEVRLRPTGDLGMAWKQAHDESLPPEAAEERRLSLVARVDSDAQALLHRCVDSFRLLGEILQGVLYGTIGGRYDTISNLGELGGRTPDQYIKRLERAHVICKTSADILADLQNTESRVE